MEKYEAFVEFDGKMVFRAPRKGEYFFSDKQRKFLKATKDLTAVHRVVAGATKRPVFVEVFNGVDEAAEAAETTTSAKDALSAYGLTAKNVDVAVSAPTPTKTTSSKATTKEDTRFVQKAVLDRSSGKIIKGITLNELLEDFRREDESAGEYWREETEDDYRSQFSSLVIRETECIEAKALKAVWTSSKKNDVVDFLNDLSTSRLLEIWESFETGVSKAKPWKKDVVEFILSQRSCTTV